MHMPAPLNHEKYKQGLHIMPHNVGGEHAGTTKSQNGWKHACYTNRCYSVLEGLHNNYNGPPMCPCATFLGRKSIPSSGELPLGCGSIPDPPGPR